MRKALLVFRKDVFRLRLELAAWVLLMAIYSWMEAVLPARPGLLAAVGLWELILAPAACYLTLATIHEDLLPGDRQDWLTKPIPRSSLLLAKVMFVVVFLNLPLALSQALGLAANGLSLSDFTGSLISRQFLFTALFIMPVAAFAAATGNFAQFAVALLCGYGAALLLGLSTATLAAQDLPWGGISWIITFAGAALALVISGSVLLLVYLPRQIRQARLILVGGVLICGLLPSVRLWHFGFEVQERVARQSLTAGSVRLFFDATRDPNLGRGLLTRRDRAGYVRVAIPIQLTDVPTGTEVLSERSETTIDGSDGPPWRSGWSVGGGILRQHGGWWQDVEIERALFETLRNRDVHLHTRIALTLLGPASVSRLSVPTANRFVPDVGFCWAMPNRVLCVSPFVHAVQVEIRSRSCATGDLSDLGIRPEISYTPYSSGLGFGLWKTDIDMMLFPGILGCEVVIEARDATAHFERDLDIPSIRLLAYRDSPGGSR
jgi:hypothetical protein